MHKPHLSRSTTFALNILLITSIGCSGEEQASTASAGGRPGIFPSSGTGGTTARSDNTKIAKTTTLPDSHFAGNGAIGSVTFTAAGGKWADGGASSQHSASGGGDTSVAGSTSVASAAGGQAPTSSTASTCASTYSNPVIWEDLPDVEILRVDDTYYYTASSFHHSPGAPVLRSYDLVNWEYLGHSVPVLDFDESYNLSNGKRSYVNGIWASSLVYRKSNKTYYWYGCMHNVGGGYMFTATSPTGPWTKHKTNFCYYDVGLLVDSDDKMYAVYGNNTLSVAQVDPDKFTQVKSQKILETPSSVGGPLEGSHFLKKDDAYYVFSTQYANGEWVLRSTSGPFGPYELKPFAVKLPFAGVGAGQSPHQGNVFDTQNGDWYYMGFNDAYPAGRLPVMAPVTWTNDGWPQVSLVGGKWGATYPFPKLPCASGKVKSRYGKDTFSSATLEPFWEWNHNPDNTKWSSGNGLSLQTATVTTDPYAARNTLTRRMPGPTSTATVEVEYDTMMDGDVMGLGAWRDTSSYIALKRKAGATKVVLVSNATLDSTWSTSSKGSEGASADVKGGKIWLRISANVRTDAGGSTAKFFYSTDGVSFTELGTTFSMKRDWQYFLGYRYALLNYATSTLGGSVRISSFDLVTP